MQFKVIGLLTAKTLPFLSIFKKNNGFGENINFQYLKK